MSNCCAALDYDIDWLQHFPPVERRPPPQLRAAGAIIARCFRCSCLKVSLLASEKELSDFLKSVEKRAFKRTVFAVRDDDSALDIVQDAMIKLSQSYGDRPAAELPLLFHRILSTTTMDWFRRKKVRQAVVMNFTDLGGDNADSDFNVLETLEVLTESHATESAADTTSRAQILLLIEGQIKELPGRQREAFLLRYWEDMDVSETAQVMGCSEGSVKTHCSRAIKALAKGLEHLGLNW